MQTHLLRQSKRTSRIELPLRIEVSKLWNYWTNTLVLFRLNAFIAHSKGEPVEQVWGGPFVMIDKDSDADALVKEATRYSEPMMNR